MWRPSSVLWFSGLHDVLVRLCFILLMDVGAEVEVFHTPGGYKSADSFAKAIIPTSRLLFTPWDHRGIVNVSYHTTQAWRKCTYRASARPAHSAYLVQTTCRTLTDCLGRVAYNY